MTHPGGQHSTEPMANICSERAMHVRPATAVLLEGARIVLTEQFGSETSVPDAAGQLVQLLMAQGDTPLKQAATATKESKAQLLPLAAHAVIEIMGSLNTLRQRMARHGAPATG